MIFLLLNVCIISNAQKKAEDNYKLGGFMEIDHISYFKLLDNKINGRDQATLQLEFKSKIKKAGSFHSSFEIREDYKDDSRNRVFLKESYIKLNKGSFDVTIGKQFLAWGKADGINPVDHFNPIDYSDLLDTKDEKIAVLAMNLEYYINSFKLQAVFAPEYTKYVLPLESSNRWNVETVPFIANSLGISNYLTGTSETILPDDKKRHSNYGISISNAIGGVDLSAYYFNGYNQLPSAKAIDLTTNDNVSDSVVINMKYIINKMQLFGFDFSTAIKGFGIRGEAAYIMPKDILIDNHYLQYAIGLDYSLTNVIASNNMTLLVQWMHDITDKNISYSWFDLNHIFQNTLLGRIELDLGYDGKLTVQSIYNMDNRDLYVQPKIEYHFTNKISGIVLLDLLSGKHDSLFGYYSKNNRYQFKLSYFF